MLSSIGGINAFLEVFMMFLTESSPMILLKEADELNH